LEGERPQSVAKTWLEVNEKGTRAAAVTVNGMASRSSKPPEFVLPPVFRADHPFIFLIRHVPSGAILFLGRLANPAT